MIIASAVTTRHELIMILVAGLSLIKARSEDQPPNKAVDKEGRE